MKGKKRVNDANKMVLTASDVRAFNDYNFSEIVKPAEENINVNSNSLLYLAKPHSINSLRIAIT
jgi:alpha-L-arabinofuranosidase